MSIPVFDTIDPLLILSVDVAFTITGLFKLVISISSACFLTAFVSSTVNIFAVKLISESVILE